MVQNHLTQLLALVAMEPPNSFEAERVRTEKVKVIEAIAPIQSVDLVFGQYGPGSIGGETVPGYRNEDGVADDSKTPTFVGIRAHVNTWRWEGVPFVLRTGKRLPKRLTQIALTFRRPALCFFHGEADTCRVHPNTLLITLQPDEGFSLAFNVKSPVHEEQLDAQFLRFSYGDAYRQLSDAYQTLILDIMQGDQTLFLRADEVEASWKLYDPLLDYHPEPHPYAAGTWGPAALDQGIALSGSAWMNRYPPMDITLQHFDDCPNWKTTDATLREILDDLGIATHIEYQLIDTPEAAERIQFRGSPTLLLDGDDLFAQPDGPRWADLPGLSNANRSCRIADQTTTAHCARDPHESV